MSIAIVLYDLYMQLRYIICMISLFSSYYSLLQAKPTYHFTKLMAHLGMSYRTKNFRNNTESDICFTSPVNLSQRCLLYRKL